MQKWYLNFKRVFKKEYITGEIKRNIYFYDNATLKK